MSMTPEQSRLIKERLEKHWKNGLQCPLCENAKWLIGSIHELKDYHHEGIIIGGQITPVLSLVCDKCGGTQFVNALIFGIVDNAGNALGRQPTPTECVEVGCPGLLDRLASFFWSW